MYTYESNTPHMTHTPHTYHPHHKHVQYVPTHTLNSKHYGTVGNYMCMEPIDGKLRFIGCDAVYAGFVIELSEYADMVNDGIISEL